MQCFAREIARARFGGFRQVVFLLFCFSNAVFGLVEMCERFVGFSPLFFLSRAGHLENTKLRRLYRRMLVNRRILDLSACQLGWFS